MTHEQRPLDRRQWAALAVAGVAAAGAGAWWAARDGAILQSARAGDGAGPLPEPVHTIDGRTLANADLAGKPVLLNFWAPWCGPCVKEMPDLDRFGASADAGGTVVLGLAIDERPAVEQFLKAHPVRFPIAVLGYAGLAWVRKLSGEANTALPFTAVFDRRGRLAQRKFGPTSVPELDAWVRKL